MKVQIKKTPFKYQLTRYLKMQNFLYQNNLYLVLGDGTFLSPLIKYKTFTNEQNDKILLIEFSKLGVKKIDEQLPELENALVAKFNSNLLRMTRTKTTVIYELILKDTEEETVILDDDIEPVKSDNIILNKYHTWDLNKTAHCLIAGGTGSGKSRVAYHIIKQFKAITNAENIFVIDPKNDELREVCRKNFNIKNIETEKSRIENMVKFYHNLMVKRFSEKEKLGKTEQDFNHAILIIDELAALKNCYNSRKEYSDNFEKYIKDIALKGRAARIHLIVMVQQPSAENLSTELRDQLGVRILMGNPINKETFTMALGQNEQSEIDKGIGEGYILITSSNENDKEKTVKTKVQDFKAPKILFPREIQ